MAWVIKVSPYNHLDSIKQLPHLARKNAQVQSKVCSINQHLGMLDASHHSTPYDIFISIVVD